MSATKLVIYRGGIVRFHIPENWREEYESTGGGTFFEEGADTGTLRLNVLSFEDRGKRSTETLQRFFRDREAQVLQCGLSMRHYLTKTEEQGTPLHIYRWEVLVPVPPSRYRLVCFSHTIFAARDGEARSRKELELVDRLVREADYSTELGKVAKRPWWKLWRR